MSLSISPELKLANIKSNLMSLGDQGAQTACQALLEYVKSDRSGDLHTRLINQSPIIIGKNKELSAIAKDFVSLPRPTQTSEVYNGDLAKIRTQGLKQWREGVEAAKAEPTTTVAPTTPTPTNLRGTLARKPNMLS